MARRVCIVRMVRRIRMVRRVWTAFLCGVLLSPLGGQELPAPPEPAAAVPGGEAAPALPAPPFSVDALLRAALSPAVPWSPGWSPTTPPDAFCLRDGDFSSITLSGPAGELTLRRGPGGVLAEFPVFLEGSLFPVTTRFDPGGGIAGFTLGDAWVIELLPPEEPALARVYAGNPGANSGDGGPYFVALSRGPLHFSETWFDREGAVLAVLTGDAGFIGDACRLIAREKRDGTGTFSETFDYDSGGNLSALSAGEARFSALYTPEHHPRYWERFFPGDPRFYTIQWDEQNRLVRMTLRTGGDDPGEDEPLDFRYEYLSDSRGNWIERREIPLIRRYGFLVPAPERVIRRRIEYAPGEPP